MKKFILFLFVFLMACQADQVSNKESVTPQQIQTNKPNITDMRDMTVVLAFKDYDNAYTMGCSGIWIKEKWILTANHCLEGLAEAVDFDNNGYPNFTGRTVSYRTYSDYLRDHEEPHATRARDAVVMRAEIATDLALLRVEGNPPAHKIATLRTKPLEDGEDILVVGHSLDMQFSLSKGIVSASRRMADLTLLQLSVAAAPGNSGGPVFDSQGNLIGVISFGTQSGLLTFATHISSISEFLGSTEMAQNSVRGEIISATLVE